jgi:PAS domain S-box-containing protein
MRDEAHSRNQLIRELALLRQRVAELENEKADRKLAEEALKESQERFRVIFDNLRDGLLLADNETKKFLMGNRAIHHMLGYSAEELYHLQLTDIHPEEALPSVTNRFEALVKGEIEIARNIPVKRKDGTVFYADISGSFPILFNGKDCLMGVFRDITERRRAEESLQESETRFRTLVERRPDAMTYLLALDENLPVLYVSPQAETIFGWPAEEFLHDPQFWLKCVHPDDYERVSSQADSLQKTGQPFAVEYRIIRRDGQIVWLHDVVHLMRDDYGRPISLLGVAIDITGRKHAEEQIQNLHSLEEKLLGTGGLDEKLKFITDGTVEIFGADFGRIWITGEGDLCDHGCIHADVTDGPDVCRNRARCLHLIASSGRYTRTDGSHRRVPLGCYKIGHVASGEDSKFISNDVTKDPRVHDHEWARNLGLVSFAGYRLLAADGKPIGVLALFRNLAIQPQEERLLQDLANTTSQVIVAGMAAEALRESEARYRQLFATVPDAIYIFDAGTRQFIDMNEGALRSYGYTREEFLKLKLGDITAEPELSDASIKETLARKTIKIPLRFHRKKDGTSFPVEISGGTFTLAGRIVLFAAIRDITKRKRAEEQVGRYRDHLEDLVKERTAELSKANEQLTRLIDEYRLAEEALLASEQRYKQLLSSVTDYIFTIEIKDGLPVSTTHGQGCIAVTGFTPEDYARMPYLWYEMVHPEDQHVVKQHSKAAIRGEARDPLEHRIIHRDGTTRWVRNTIVPRYDTVGKYVACDGLVSDITDRKNVEHEFKQTNTYLENIFENSPDAIGIVDGSGRFIRWNRMAAELYGYTFEEMKGKSGFELYEDRDELERMLMHLRQEGTVKKREMRMKKKDGSIVPFEISIGLLKNSQNKTLGSVAVARDLSGIKEALSALKASNEQLYQEITERRRAEESLLKSEETLQESERNLRSLATQLFTIQEAERKRISSELHDGLGQELTVLKIYLTSMQNKLEEDQQSLKDECEFLLSHIDDSIENMRRLCHDLSPYLLEELGLSPSLKHLFNEVCQRNDLLCLMEIEEISKYLPRRTLSAVYRIFQEALTNIVKHSGATQVSLSIKRQAGKLNFMVADNGKGFDIRSVTRRPASERGMGLFAMAERTRMLGGSFQILSQKGEGTQISFSLPLKEEGKQ